MVNIPMQDTAAQATRELLQDLAARAGDSHSHCLLLLDPSLRPVNTNEAPWTRYAECPHHPVHVAHSNVAAAHRPVLTTLDTELRCDESLLSHSMQEALIEATPESLQKGNGRRIGGWLVSQSSGDEVASHLGQIMVQRHPAGRTVWLRLQDPAVLWLVWGWLEDVQRAALLGPVERFYLLNPAGQLQRFTCNEKATSAELDLSGPQWSAIDCIEPLNAALRRWSGSPSHPDQLRPARSTALAAIQRGKRLGFNDAADLAFYGFCSLTVHARFDFHSLVVARLRARKPGDYFGGLVADLEAKDWQRIAKEAPPGKAV